MSGVQRRKWKGRSSGAKSTTSLTSPATTTSWYLGPDDTSPLLELAEERIAPYATPRLVRAKQTGSKESEGGGANDTDSETGECGLMVSALAGSIDRLFSSSSQKMDSEVGPFRREIGSESRVGEDGLSPPMHALLENPESETRWYFKYFLGKVHYNYLCYNSGCPFFLSVVYSDSIYRCILWRKTGNKRLCVKSTTNGKWPSPRSILEKFSVRYDKTIKEVAAVSIQKEVLTLEEQEGAVNFKFGVLYAKAGQRADDEMYNNFKGGDDFSIFLDLLGDEITLEGWENFRGGLDNKNNTTGTNSVYTVFEGHEIMFHVSTMLPYTDGKTQQLERKRHIGNDIIVIIFVDGDTEEEAYESALAFNPHCMRSHFNHIFGLVTYSRERDCYRVVVHSAESVPAFGPPVNPGGAFVDHIAFRDFLLAKLINGEKAAYCTPTFAEKRERTLDLLLKNVEQKCTTEYRRSVSVPALHSSQSSPNSNRKQLDYEQSFVEYGQRLKVDKIITGHHPTSQRTTVAPKRDPWETQCISEGFPYQITCGDACEDGSLVVSTASAGTYYLYSDGSYSLIIDKSVPIGQLQVAHRHRVILFRTAFLKEANYFYAIPLKIFFKESESIATKSSLRPYHIPYTKGCHLFCTAPLDSQFLRVGVAVKNKVYMMAWKYAASLVVNGSPILPTLSPNPINRFVKHRELILPDVPVLMTLLDERPSGKLCVSYQKQTVVDAVDEITATAQRIPNLDIAKARLTSLTSVHSNTRSELLVGYDLTCQLITLHDGTAYNSVEIVWNAEPRDLVYMFPYILAFTANTVEIRMASNGSLMQTINVPDARLFSKKGDLYFTSTSPLYSWKTESCKISPMPNEKVSKMIDKKSFACSTKLPKVNLFYVYKIMAASMLGRRDSTASSLSIQSVNSSEEQPRRESASDTIAEDSHSTSSSLDLVIHPIAGDTESIRNAAPGFTSDVGSPASTKRKPINGHRILDADPSTEFDPSLEVGWDSQVGGATEVGEASKRTRSCLQAGRTSFSMRDTIDLSGSASSSPDGRVGHEDFSGLGYRPKIPPRRSRDHHHSRSSPSLFQVNQGSS